MYMLVDLWILWCDVISCLFHAHKVKHLIQFLKWMTIYVIALVYKRMAEFHRR